MNIWNMLGGAELQDAPSDGSEYVRKNGEWAVVTPATPYTSVSLYTDLPAAVDHNGETYEVVADVGVATAGFYRSNGTTWKYIGIDTTSLKDSTTIIVDTDAPTKKMTFDASGVTAGQTRTLKMADTNVDLKDIALKVVANAPIVAGTGSKLTVDAKGLVTAIGDLVKADIGLGNVDNTTDANKPVSTAQQTALNLKATRFPGICMTTPITEADISIDLDTRVLTVTPPLGYFVYYTDGNGVITKHTQTGAIDFPAFTDTSGIWNFYFNDAGEAVTAQGSFPDFDVIATVFRLLWNAAETGDARIAVAALETHDNSIPAIDHAWKHKQGAIWYSGLDCFNNAIATGIPNTDGRNSVISLNSGRVLDDNLEYGVTSSTDALDFNQDLGNITPASLTALNAGLFEVRYQTAQALVYNLPATRFPFPWDVATNRPEFITAAGVRTLVPDNSFFVVYVYVIQDPRPGKAIKVVTAPTSFTSLTLAQASSWNDIQSIYSTLNDGEIRPLYKLIFEANNTGGGSFPAGCKYACLRSVNDIRKANITQATQLGGSMPASSITVLPTSTLVATNVASALTELDTKKIGMTAEVEAVGTFTAANKVKVAIGGVEYWIALDPVL